MFSRARRLRELVQLTTRCHPERREAQSKDLAELSLDATGSSTSLGMTVRYLGPTATKSRTGFRPEIENALPSSRANQNALEEPPSRFIARRIFESSTTGAVARMFAKSASETSEQNPRNARSFVAIPAKVRRAACESFNPRICLFPS